MSSSEEDIVMLALYAICRGKKKSRRRWWIHPLNQRRIQHENYSALHDLEDEDKFRSVYQMSRSSFSELLKKVGPAVQRQNTRLRLAVAAEEKLLICLRYLATGSSFRSLSFHFLRGETTIGAIVKEVTKEIWKNLSPEYMAIPKQEQWGHISTRFYQMWNIPNCLGAIGGKHVRVKNPPKTESLEVNYKGYFSQVLMAVVDADHNFIAVDVGDYGKNSDGKLFSNSHLGKMILKDSLDFPRDAALPGTTEPMPHFFVADEAFPLHKRIIRPYAGRQYAEDKKVFNDRLSKGQKVIDCTFEMLVSKFRCFEMPLACHVDAVNSILKCACVLHNYIRKREGRLSETSNEPVIILRNFSHGNREVHQLGKEHRDRLKNYFKRNPVPSR